MWARISTREESSRVVARGEEERELESTGSGLMRFFVGVVVVVVAYGFGGSLGRSAVLSHSRGRDVGMDQKQRVHVLLVVQQLLHILKEFTIIGTGLGSLRLSLFADHDDVPPLQMDRFGRILVFQGVYEIILQIVFVRP